MGTWWMVVLTAIGFLVMWGFIDTWLQLIDPFEAEREDDF